MKEDENRPPLYCKEGDRVILASKKPELQKYNGMQGEVFEADVICLDDFEELEYYKDKPQKLVVRFDEYPHLLIDGYSDDYIKEARPARMRVSSDPIVKRFEDDLIDLFANIFADGFKK